MLWTAFATLALYVVGSITQVVVMLTGPAGEADRIDASALGYGARAPPGGHRLRHLGGLVRPPGGVNRRVTWIGACGAPLVLGSVLVVLPVILGAVGLLSVS